MADTTATLTQEMKTFYDTVMLSRSVPNLVHTQLGQKRDIPVGGGRSIEFRRLNSPGASTTALTEGTAPTASSITISIVTATVKKLLAVGKSVLINGESLNRKAWQPSASVMVAATTE